MKHSFFIFGLSLILIVPQALGATTSSSCPGVTCENAFNKVTDSLATLGKDPTTAQQITNQRRKIRRLNRQKSINQANAAKLKAKRQAWLNSGNNL